MEKIIFVYNANTGFFNALTDSAHKLFSPKTYSCNLCKLTHGLTSMKSDWADFIKSLNIELEFLHKDEFKEKFPNNFKEELPAVFTLENKKLTLAISAKELNKAKSINDLKNLINQVK
jgi:hypothetical protein